MSLPAKLPLRGRSESQGSRRSRGTRPSSITPATTEDPGSSALGIVGAEGRRQPPGPSGTPRWERPGALPAAAPGLACPPTTLLLAGTRSLWREMRALAVASPLARPWVTSLSNTTCELASPSRAGYQQSRCGRRARSSPDSGRRAREAPPGSAALDCPHPLAGCDPVLRQSSARLGCSRSSGRLAFRAMPLRVSSMTICRSSRPPLISCVLLTPAHRHTTSVGASGRRDDPAPRAAG